MEPLVSVIIPVYNVLPYLREALDSVINQTYKNLEILVVDDGSTDGSGEICDEYLSDPRVIVIHQENKGLSGARNTALDRMTGEYVAFLDSDDAFMPEMIEKMIEALNRNNANVSICGYDECYTTLNLNLPMVQRAARYSYPKETILSPADIFDMIITDHACWAVWDKIYQHAIWNTIRFPEGENYEDMRVMCQILDQCTKIVTVPKISVLYRQRTGSITKSPSEKNLHDYLKAVHIVEKHILDHCSETKYSESLQVFLERYACTLSKHYSRLLYHSHSSASFVQIRREILFLWKRIEKPTCHLRSQIVRFLFLYTPWLLAPFNACWCFGKHLIRRMIYS